MIHTQQEADVRGPKQLIAQTTNQAGADVVITDDGHGLVMYCAGCTDTDQTVRSDKKKLISKAQEHANGCTFKP